MDELPETSRFKATFLEGEFREFMQLYYDAQNHITQYHLSKP